MVFVGTKGVNLKLTPAKPKCMHIIYQAESPDYGFEHDLLRTYGPENTIENKRWVPFDEIPDRYFPIKAKGNILSLRKKILPVIEYPNVRSSDWAYGTVKFYQSKNKEWVQAGFHQPGAHLRYYPPVLVYTGYYLNDDIFQSKFNCFVKQDYPAPLMYFIINHAHPTHNLGNLPSSGRRRYVLPTDPYVNTPLNQRGFNYVINWVDGYYPPDYISRLVGALGAQHVDAIYPVGYQEIHGSVISTPALVDFFVNKAGAKQKEVRTIEVPDLILRGDLSTEPNRYFTGSTEPKMVPLESFQKIERDGNTGFGFCNPDDIPREKSAYLGSRKGNVGGTSVRTAG